MKWNFSIPLTLTLLVTPGMLLALQGGSGNGSQQPQEQLASSVNTQGTAQSTTDEARKTLRGHYVTCDKSLDQAREHARTLSRDAKNPMFSLTALRGQHQKLQEQVRTLQANRERLIEALSKEQLSSIQDHSQSMQEMHESIQKRLQAMDQEFTGSTFHLTTVSNEARAAEREMKTYQKQLGEAGKTLDLLRD